MKKLLTTLLISSSFASASFASDVDVKLKGFFDFQAGAKKQKNLEGDNKLTQNQKNTAFNSKGAVRAVIDNTTDCGLKYGANIVLKTTSNSAATIKNGSYLFLESDKGRVEAGSAATAFSNMSISAYNIASATGDDFLGYVNLNPTIYGTDTKQAAYLADINDYSYVYSGFTSGNISEETRSITYYTPKFSGIQLGVSFTPDTTNVGAGSIMSKGVSTNLIDKEGNKYETEVSVKNLAGVGITYEHNISDGFDVKIGAGYEGGKSNAKITKPESKNTTIKLENFKLYNFGAVVSYGNWSVAGSYATSGKSLTSKTYHFDKRDNKLYTAGVGYNQGPIGLSLTYLRNDKFKNRLDAYTLATDYSLAPGFKPYAEVTSFKLKNKAYDVSAEGAPKPANKKHNGIVYMLGTRVSF
jgi:hypothetical protein